MEQLSEENFWQLLELIASPDVDMDTDAAAQFLYLISYGDALQKQEATKSLILMVRELLPDFATV